MRRTIYAILLVTALECLWFAAESNGWRLPGTRDRRALKVSLGFPVPCLSYTAVHTEGDSPAWENYPDRNDWQPGFHIRRAFFPLDALVAVAAFFGFRWLLKFEAGRAASAGFVLGLVMGVLGALGSIPAWESVSRWVFAVIWLAGLPTVICFLTRRARSVWMPYLMSCVAMSVIPWMSHHLDYLKPDRGFSFAARSFSVWKWYPSMDEVLFLPLISMAILAIPIFLIRRFAPGFGRQETPTLTRRMR